MSGPINDGGPVFPVTKSWVEDFYDDAGYAYARQVTGLAGGLTLRDYFAAKAMQALIARDKFRVGMAEPSEEQQAACSAYSFADRMIKARES